MIDKNDIVMIAMIPVMYIAQWFFYTMYNITAFSIYHIIFISAGYGGYITIRLFVIVQRKMAIKKGLLSQLEDINKIEKKDKSDRPRWIK